jgi:hypothetical protein
MDDHLSPYITGSHPPPQSVGLRPVTDKEKVELWFIEPLSAMKGDEAFLCLTACFPLLETVLRYELGIPDDQDVPFSDRSPALHWFAEFMTIPEAASREIWDAFRNGLLHRAMVKGTLKYDLTGRAAGRPAEIKDDRIVIYVWDFRDEVVAKLKKHHRKLWNTKGTELPKIYVRA